MVPPTLFVSGGIAILHLCKDIYLKYQSVKRYRDDCKKLAHFVHRVEGFLMETEDEADMTGPGWQAAFTALHESLVEVSEVFDDCAKFGIVRSLINADEINLRLSSIAQRMTMALQLIPIQKAKVTDRRLGELHQLQHEIHTAQFAAARAAEQQSAQLKRLMDQSRLDASKTQEMLTQVLQLLQADAATTRTSAAAAAAGPGPAGGPAAAAAAAAVVCPAQLDAEVEDLKAEMMLAQRNKNVLEEQYLAQIIAAIEAMEVTALEAQQSAAGGPAAPSTDLAEEVPLDLLCPITRELLEDPVILVDSHQTYERQAIEEWLGRGNTKDPVTGILLSSSTLVPNVLVRKLAREWLEAHPTHRNTAATAAAAAATAPQAAFSVAGAGGSDMNLKTAACTSGSDISSDCKHTAQRTAAAAAGFDSHSAAQLNTTSSSSKGNTPCHLQLEHPNSDDGFSPNPKAAAALAAAQHHVFDPSMLFTKQQQLQRDHGLDEKAAAQRAYAWAVAEAAAAAAAAAAEDDSHSQGIAVYSILRGAGGAHRRSAPQECGPSVQPPVDGAMSAAAGQQLNQQLGSMSLLDYQQQQQQQLGQQQQQQAAYGQFQRQQDGQQLRGNSVNGSPLRPAPVDRAGSPTDAGWLARDTVTLQDFRATFGRVAQSRTHLTMKHGTQIEKIVETQRAERAQQLQREIEKQELAGQISSYEARWKLQQLQQQEQQSAMQDHHMSSDSQPPPTQHHLDAQHSPQDIAARLGYKQQQQHHQHAQQQHAVQQHASSFHGHGLEHWQAPQQSLQPPPQQQPHHGRHLQQAPQQLQPHYSRQQTSQQLDSHASGALSVTSNGAHNSDGSSITFRLPNKDAKSQAPLQVQQQQQQGLGVKPGRDLSKASYASSTDSGAPSLAHYATAGVLKTSNGPFGPYPSTPTGLPASHPSTASMGHATHAAAGAAPAYSPTGSKSLTVHNTGAGAAQQPHQRVSSMPAAAAPKSACGPGVPQYPGSNGSWVSSSSCAAAGGAGGAAGGAGASKGETSRWSFGRKKASKDKDDVGALDDAVSVSSDGSASTSASRKSVGKSMMGVLRNISYSVVYDDGKC